MTTWQDASDFEYKEDINGNRFARIMVSISAEERHGYFSSTQERGEGTFYIHYDTGIVTADPIAFHDWMLNLVKRSQFAGDPQ